MIKALLLDFDGTLVTKDMLSEVIDLVGRKAESEQITRDFHAGKYIGQQAITARINLLRGVEIEKIQAKVREDLSLMPNAKEIIDYCRRHGILTVLASGNIVQILDIYKENLGLDFVVGPQPHTDEGKIVGIAETDFRQPNFKVEGIKDILREHGIRSEECLAIGDSPGDKAMFEFVGKGRSVAIQPKGGIEEYTGHTIQNLTETINIIKSFN